MLSLSETVTQRDAVVTMRDEFNPNERSLENVNHTSYICIKKYNLYISITTCLILILYYFIISIIFYNSFLLFNYTY